VRDDESGSSIQKQLDRQRRRLRLLWFPGGAFAATVVIAVVIDPPPDSAANKALALSGLVSWVACVIGIFTVPALCCTQCAARVEGELRKFCPECGVDSVRHGRWLESARCDSCRKPLVRGRRGGGLWTIVFCTTVALDFRVTE
jgi:hypothetical protein